MVCAALSQKGNLKMATPMEFPQHGSPLAEDCFYTDAPIISAVKIKMAMAMDVSTYVGP